MAVWIKYDYTSSYHMAKVVTRVLHGPYGGKNFIWKPNEERKLSSSVVSLSNLVVWVHYGSLLPRVLAVGLNRLQMLCL